MDNQRQYIQITTRCNMKCAHCCFDCTEQGEDMDEYTFKKCLAKIETNKITIGGGEPTLHSYLFYFMQYALENGFNIGITTNGKKTREAIALLEFAEENKERVTAMLSVDMFHEKIDDYVVGLYVKNKRVNYLSNVHVVSAGRAKKNKITQLYPNSDPVTIITPSGGKRSMYLSAKYNREELNLRKLNLWGKKYSKMTQDVAYDSNLGEVHA